LLGEELESIVAYRSAAKRRLCKQRPLLGNAHKIYNEVYSLARITLELRESLETAVECNGEEMTRKEVVCVLQLQ
jgi:hypothetical protein